MADPASAPVETMEGKAAIINLRDIGLSRHDTPALFFHSPEGNTISAEYATVKEGWVWFWMGAHWLCLDATELDLSVFKERITLLPIPQDMPLLAVGGLARHYHLSTYSLHLR